MSSSMLRRMAGLGGYDLYVFTTATVRVVDNKSRGSSLIIAVKGRTEGVIIAGGHQDLQGCRGYREIRGNLAVSSPGRRPLQFTNGLDLDLADPLAGDGEDAADFR